VAVRTDPHADDLTRVVDAVGVGGVDGVGRVDDRDPTLLPQEGVLGAGRWEAVGTGHGVRVDIDAHDPPAVVDVVGEGDDAGDVDRPEPAMLVDEAVDRLRREEAVRVEDGALVDIRPHRPAPVVEAPVHGDERAGCVGQRPDAAVVDEQVAAGVLWGRAATPRVRWGHLHGRCIARRRERRR
jgi:hypothetical protein